MKTNLNPKVSIIIPVYNGSNYLDEAIKSALVQTYKNVEIIVVNDGSNDNGATEKIVKSYGDKILYFNKENGGVASALNTGLDKMTGDYFSWLSHDDLYYEYKIEKQIEYLKNFQNEKVILYSDYSLINKNGRKISDIKLDTFMLNQKPLYSILRGSIHGCSLLIPAKAFSVCGKFDESLRTTQDYDLWFRMRNEFCFVHMPEILIKSRWHAEQDSKKNPRTMLEANQMWSGFLEKLKDDEILKVEKTKYIFLKKMVEFLGKTPYDKSLKFYSEELSRESIFLTSFAESIKISVVIPFKNRMDWTIEALSSVMVRLLFYQGLITTITSKVKIAKKVIMKISKTISAVFHRISAK